jgi:NADPH:quinone reductase-like Zn-dependent oxidoreductase
MSVVRVSAASINPLDKMVRNGEFKRLLKYRPPFVLGTRSGRRCDADRG